MGKGSGSTRRSSSSSKSSTVVDYAGNITSEAWDNMVDKIKKTESIDFDNWEKLSTEQKELLLMESGFTGLVGDDLDMGTLYYSQNKSDFISSLADDLSNIAGGYGIDDSVSWKIGFSDGSVKYLSEMEDDLSGSFGVTSKQSYNTQKKKVEDQLRDSKISFILRSDGYDQPRFYVSPKNNGLERLKKYGGFEVWKNGRGEKKRDYIQDDWI